MCQRQRVVFSTNYSHSPGVIHHLRQEQDSWGQLRAAPARGISTSLEVGTSLGAQGLGKNCLRGVCHELNTVLVVKPSSCGLQFSVEKPRCYRVGLLETSPAVASLGQGLMALGG